MQIDPVLADLVIQYRLDVFAQRVLVRHLHDIDAAAESQAHIAPNASIHLDEFEPAIATIELELGAEHSAVADVPKEPFQVFGGVAHWFDVDADQATAVAKFAVLGADATPGKQRPYASVAIHE